jgi:probable non-F420 flavinoid oxidoreductase
MSTVALGFHCSHEQSSPSTLLRLTRRAASAGFMHAMCSDHFHPWSERQGQSGFAWSWLGAALEATPLSFGTVCAPGQRYHPAVIAQAAATLTEMYPGRFWFAIGSGEALNEAITGDAWPSKDIRNRRAEESAAVMRALWTGETVSVRNSVTVAGARLYSRPATPPRLFGAALTPDTARWLAGWADGMITVSAPRETMRAVVEAFREGGGATKPVFLQAVLSFASSHTEAERAAYDQWRHCALNPRLLADLVTPAEFDRRSEGVSLAKVHERVRVSCDVQQHLEWLYEDCALGFDRIYLHNVARSHQEAFLDACGTQLIPAISKLCANSVTG